MRVLLTDGSGLTARQTATQLSHGGHTVEVLSSDPRALTRFTKYVRRVHSVPPYGVDPYAWLDRALEIYTSGSFDVLFPTQEQVAVLSRSLGRLHKENVVTAVPTFDALAAVQDKVAADATLGTLGLPKPDTAIALTAAELAAHRALPAFVKQSIGTATSGVAYVADGRELHALASAWEATGVFDHGAVLVQTPLAGPLVMIQSVFDRGRLVAHHANLREREGTRGGSSHKRSIDLPILRDHLEILGDHLAWHGGLSADAILTEDGPVSIDINPRLVEPGNAWRSGVDLVDAFIRVARGDALLAQQPGRPGVATHQLLLAVMRAAQEQQPRRAMLRELVDAARHHGSYGGSVEELTPIRHDPRTIVPVAAATALTLLRPSVCRSFGSDAVANYALTPTAWRALVDGGTDG